jgi:hypothetical protein
VQRDVTGDTFTVTVNWDDPTAKYIVAIIGKKTEEVERAVDFEDRSVSFEEFGKVYEYPQCCVEGYFDVEEGDDWISSYLRRSGDANFGYFEGNRLATIFDGSTLTPDYFPCRLDCVPTRELGRRYMSILNRAGWNLYLDRTKIMLRQPIFIRGESLLQLRDASVNGERVEYEASKARRFNWKGELRQTDPFWESDCLIMSGQRVRLTAGNNVIADEPVSIFNNRLIVCK